jgi:hypothetical protein
MNNVQGIDVKKAFLCSLVISVVLSALLGIFAILAGNAGWFEVRVLLTTVTISAASICGLANGAFLATKRGIALPAAGIALALIGAGLLICGIWAIPNSEFYWKLTVSVAVFAVACGHLALLSMARLAQGFRWSLRTAYVVIFGVATLIVGLIVSDVHGGNTGIFQLLAVAAITDAAITILIPIFHWLSTSQFPKESDASNPKVESTDNEIARLKERIADLERQKARN